MGRTSEEANGRSGGGVLTAVLLAKWVKFREVNLVSSRFGVGCRSSEYFDAARKKRPPPVSYGLLGSSGSRQFTDEKRPSRLPGGGTSAGTPVLTPVGSQEDSIHSSPRVNYFTSRGCEDSLDWR